VKEKLLELHRKGIYLSKVAKMLGKNPATIRWWEQKLGIRFKRKSKRYPKELKDRVVEEVKSGVTISKVSKKYGIPYATIQMWLREQGIRARECRVEKAKKEMLKILSERGPCCVDDIAREVGLQRATVMKVVAEDERFVAFKLMVGRRGGIKYGGHELFDGIVGRSYIALKDDPKTVEFVASHIPGGVTRGKARALYSRLAEFFDRDMARRIIEKAGYKYRSKPKRGRSGRVKKSKYEDLVREVIDGSKPSLVIEPPSGEKYRVYQGIKYVLSKHKIPATVMTRGNKIYVIREDR